MLSFVVKHEGNGKSTCKEVGRNTLSCFSCFQRALKQNRVQSKFSYFKLFLVDLISSSASSTRDLGTRSLSTLRVNLSRATISNSS